MPIVLLLCACTMVWMCLQCCLCLLFVTSAWSHIHDTGWDLVCIYSHPQLCFYVPQFHSLDGASDCSQLLWSADNITVISLLWCTLSTHTHRDKLSPPYIDTVSNSTCWKAPRVFLKCRWHGMHGFACCRKILGTVCFTYCHNAALLQYIRCSTFTWPVGSCVNGAIDSLRICTLCCVKNFPTSSSRRCRESVCFSSQNSSSTPGDEALSSTSRKVAVSGGLYILEWAWIEFVND